MHHPLNYNEIYNDYSPKIKRDLNSTLSIEESKDLLQDIFIKVLETV